MILSLEDFNKMGEFLHGLTWRGTFAKQNGYGKDYIKKVSNKKVLKYPVTKELSDLMAFRVALKRYKESKGYEWSQEAEETVQVALESINEGKK